ncbi:uncharacterized protein LOC144369491 [Ictidomys tridecemlineatus]
MGTGETQAPRQRARPPVRGAGKAGDVSPAGWAELGPARGGGGERAERQTREGGGRAALAALRRARWARAAGPRDPRAPPPRGAAAARPHAPRSTAPSLRAPPLPASCQPPGRGRLQSERSDGAPGQLEQRRWAAEPWTEPPDPEASERTLVRRSDSRPNQRSTPTLRRRAPAGGKAAHRETRTARGGAAGLFPAAREGEAAPFQTLASQLQHRNAPRLAATFAVSPLEGATAPRPGQRMCVPAGRPA